MTRLRIAGAEGWRLFDESGQAYTDLFAGNGCVSLGHNDPAVRAAVERQLGRVWITGGLDNPAAAEARAALEGFAGGRFSAAALYSTGMEAAEFAIRYARSATGRIGAVGFSRNMHGKSLATAYLGWDNGDGVRLPGFARLPFVPDEPEARVLELLADRLASGGVSAVFVEPVQGSGGGHAASADFHREAARLCRGHGALLVFDEILTGFHRTGPAFAFEALGVEPDLLLVGKGMGNGFPVSGVLVNRRLPPLSADAARRALPSSTFAGNPLAAAAVTATIGRMGELDMPALAAGICRAVREELGPLTDAGFALRGRGALWALEPPAGADALNGAEGCFAAGAAVGVSGRLIRVSPPVTIDPGELRAALRAVRGALA